MPDGGSAKRWYHGISPSFSGRVYFLSKRGSHYDGHELEQLREAFERGELHPMEAKKRLAGEIVTMYHGAEEAQEAAERFARVVQRKEQPDAIPVVRLAAGAAAVDVVTLLCQCNLVSSKSEARRLIEQGGLSIDGLRITDPNHFVVPTAGTIIKAGKRKYARLEI